MNLGLYRSFDAGFGGEPCETLERRDELRPAIRIARVVERIHAEKNVGRFEHLRPREGHREKDRVPRWNVCDGYFATDGVRYGVFRHVDVVGERGPAKRAQVHLRHKVFRHAERAGDAACGFDLVFVTLAVANRERVRFEPLSLCQCQRGGGVETATQQHDRAPAIERIGQVVFHYLRI